ncbi:hypothetical protein J4Q44_G00254020 [Coregonus suidteri]|uniref:Retinitis pigmentosa 1-like 1 protein n=1 Tax=Coregonus suidteri TaxID=861788 RepID=A0AAN8LNP5_9TELE
MSAKSNASAKSSRSHKSTGSHNVRAASANSETPEVPIIETTGEGEEAEEGEETDERAESSMSAKSSHSAKSRRSCQSTCSKAEQAPSPNSPEVPATEPEPAEDDEREASAMSAKTRASIKSSRTHKSACKATSPKPAACETPVNDQAEKTEGEKTVSASVRSTCSRSVRAERPVAKEFPATTTTGGDENGSAAAAGDTEERPASAMSDNNDASVKSSRSHKSTYSKAERAPSSNSPVVPASEPAVDAEGEERAASVMSAKTTASAKSSRSHKSTCSRSVRAETPGTKDIPAITTTGGDETVDDTAAAGDTEERPASAISAKTIASVKSRRSHKSTCSRRAETPSSRPADVPVIETTGGDEVGEEKERAASLMSAKSNASAKSRRSNRPGSSRAQDVPAIETTGEEEEGDKEEEETERPASAMSAKSTASVMSTRSHKSTSSRRAGTPASEQADVVETTGGEGTERPASAMSTKSNGSAKSSSSHKSTCNGSTGAVSPAPITAEVPAIETTGVDGEGEKTEERPASAVSAKSHVSAKSSTSHKSNGTNRSMFLHLKKERGEKGYRPAPSTTGHDLETGSVKSAVSTKPKSKADSSTTRPLSRAPQASAKSTNQTPPATTETTKTKEESQSKAASRTASKAAHRDDDVRDDVTEKKAPSVHTRDSRAASSACSTRSKVKVQKASEAQDEERPETRASFLQVKGHRVRAQSNAGSVRSVKTSKTEKIVIKGNSRPKSAKAGDPLSQSLNPPEGSRPTIQLGTASVSDSLLSQSLSATDLLRGNMAASRPSSPAGSKVSITDSGKSGSSQKSKKPKQEEEEIEELDPLCLPNTSPNDVVSDWLRGIPADSGMDNPEDEMNEGIEETEEKGEEGEEKGRETEGQGGEETEEKQEPVETTEMEQENTAETGQQEQEVKKAAQQPEEEGEVKEEEEEREEEEEKEVKEEEEREEGECSECADCCPDPAPPTNDITSPCHPHLFLSSESELPRSCHSSVAVMKVLLSPSLGRCSSLPEIGSVYGRRLSSSAKGLLDCLAQLQLIDPPTSPAADPSPDRGQSYQEVMDILQSLWLSEPEKGKEDEGEEKERLKDSGVDLTSVSAGSGGSGKTRPDETAGDITLIAEGERGEGEGEGEAGEGEAGEGEAAGGGEEAASPAATPDITSRVRGSPGDDEGRGELLQTPESLQIPGSPSSSDSTAYKSPTDTERDTPEDTPSSGTPPSVQRALLTKRVSQDPDPVWVLNLLKKLEKQFMTHYVDAMAEFKVRWDLDDNAMLDAMITELRDEVKKRIQTSIDHELRKIRGRASRGPRPPNLSRESAETDQRRRRLKVSGANP